MLKISSDSFKTDSTSDWIQAFMTHKSWLAMLIIFNIHSIIRHRIESTGQMMNDVLCLLRLGLSLSRQVGQHYRGFQHQQHCVEEYSSPNELHEWKWRGSIIIFKQLSASMSLRKNWPQLYVFRQYLISRLTAQARHRNRYRLCCGLCHCRLRSWSAFWAEKSHFFDWYIKSEVAKSWD